MDFNLYENLYYNETSSQTRDVPKYPTFIEIEQTENYLGNQQITFRGKYSADNKKIQRWNIVVDDEIVGGGEYDLNGQKTGLWVELPKNFNQLCKITYIGEYQNGLRFGKWNALENDHTVESGVYDRYGRKIEKWRELHPNYNENFKIVMEGLYVNNKKTGKWFMIYKEKIVGGGTYNKLGYQTSKWQECQLQFNEVCQIINLGKYKKGIKIGVWEYKYNSLATGGGTYDNDGLKQGQWIEPLVYDQMDVLETFIGNCRDGKKVGQWNIFNSNYCVIGGGQYDNNGYKHQQWTEINDKFRFNQVKCNGKYQNSKKIGLWKWTKSQQSTDEIIGGGYMSIQEKKIGLWVDLSEQYSETCRMVYSGYYFNTSEGQKNYLEGQKIFRWNIIYNNKKIGGGRYNLEGKKVGKWIEEYQDFSNNCQILFGGEYKNGLKIGIWDILCAQDDSFQLKIIGQGFYNSENKKCGRWVEINKCFNNFFQIYDVGNYCNGIKIWKWQTKHQETDIAYGKYNENGIKTGKWLELSPNFSKYLNIQFSGEYRDGLKFGNWTIIYQNQQIGGGNYDEKGLKQGLWRILHDNFQENLQLIMKGQYQNAIKVNEWQMLDLLKQETFKQSNYYHEGSIIFVPDPVIQKGIDDANIIGGGNYGQNGMMNGIWTVLIERLN